MSAAGVQVCVLIDPNMTLTETAAANTPPAAAGGSSGAVPGDSSDVDIKKLVQVSTADHPCQHT